MDVKALFVDAANTLLKPREPVGVTYAREARRHGVDADPVVVERRFRGALRHRRGEPQVGDGRAYWSRVVAESVDVDLPGLNEALYQHYANPRAWWVDIDALRTLGVLARRGVRLGIISNFDTRLRVLYNRYALDRMFPTLVCSAEVEVDKPDPAIFRIACACAGVSPRNAVHVGDDPELDVSGANAAGLVGLLYDDELGWQGIADHVAQLGRPYFR